MTLKTRNLSERIEDVCFIMQTEEGREVQVNERADFPDEVWQPI